MRIFSDAKLYEFNLGLQLWVSLLSQVLANVTFSWVVVTFIHHVKQKLSQCSTAQELEYKFRKLTFITVFFEISTVPKQACLCPSDLISYLADDIQKRKIHFYRIKRTQIFHKNCFVKKNGPILKGTKAPTRLRL